MQIQGSAASRARRALLLQPLSHTLHAEAANGLQCSLGRRLTSCTRYLSF